MKKILLLLFLVMTSTAMWSDTCPYCNGTGQRVVFSGKTGGYGLDPIYRTCPQCGQTVNTNGVDHKHTCTYCNGTGRVQSTREKLEGSHSSNSSSSSNRDVNGSVDPVVQAWAKKVAYAIKYGIVLSSLEIEQIKQFAITNPTACANFRKWFDMAQSQIIFYNQSFALCGYRYANPDALVKQWNEFVGELNQIPLSTNEDVRKIWERTDKELNRSFNCYLEWTRKFYNLNQLQNNLDNMMLYYY